MIFVGVKELKNSLSHYLSFIKKGEMIFITERGKRIARITAILSSSKMNFMDQLGPAAAKGVVTLPTRHLRKAFGKRTALAGKPLSEMILEDRR